MRSDLRATSRACAAPPRKGICLRLGFRIPARPGRVYLLIYVSLQGGFRGGNSGVAVVVPCGGVRPAEGKGLGEVNVARV